MRAGPDFATVRAQVDDAVEWFHHGVGKIRHVVFGSDGLRGGGESRGGIADFARDGARSGGKFGKILEHFRSGESRVFAVVPGDFEFFAGQLRGPEAVGDDSDAGRNLLNDANTFDFESLRRIEAGDFAAEDRGPSDEGEEHSGQLNIQPKLSGAVDLGRRVQAVRGSSD